MSQYEFLDLCALVGVVRVYAGRVFHFWLTRGALRAVGALLYIVG